MLPSEGHPTSKDIEGSICVSLCGLYVLVNLAFNFFWSAVIAFQPQAFKTTLICPRKCLQGSLPGWFTLICWPSVQMSSILRTFSELHVLFPVIRYHVSLFPSQHLLNFMTIVFAYLLVDQLSSLMRRQSFKGAVWLTHDSQTQAHKKYRMESLLNE